jgi:serine/threonine protein phosphatase PrpC
MSLVYAGKTDIGQKRKTNQDCIYIGGDEKLFIVADGMGGHNGGDIAAQMAVEVIPQLFVQKIKKKDKKPEEVWSSSVKEANQSIRERGLDDPELKGMGTTVVSIFFKEDTAYIGNVGDSRAYLFSGGKLYQLSRDHSLVQEKMNAGIYTREDAAADPMKNVLVRTVGFEENVEVDIYKYKVSRNDLLFLCSDGLHGKVSERDISHLISENLKSPETTSQKELQSLVEKLIAQANANGGQDNISVVMVLTN